jgi:uncharacterized protein YggE
MRYLSANLVIALAIVLLLPFAALAAEKGQPRLITVSGDAEVKVAPDEVIITLGVETWNEDLEVAKSENDQRVRKIIDTVKQHGVEEKHVQTDHRSIEPRYRDQWEHRTFIGYFVRKTVVVTLKDITLFEDLLSSVLKAGANYLHGIQFRTTELRKHRDKARALAIKAAREKAHALAGELGQKVGKPHSIQEGYGGWGYFRGWGSRWGGGMMQNVVQQGAGGTAAGESSIAPGQISVTAQVTVSFELE